MNYMDVQHHLSLFCTKWDAMCYSGTFLENDFKYKHMYKSKVGRAILAKMQACQQYRI